MCVCKMQCTWVEDNFEGAHLLRSRHAINAGASLVCFAMRPAKTRAFKSATMPIALFRVAFAAREGEKTLTRFTALVTAEQML